jgi:signal transduction histidine kinase/ActR/RegA family two-component response regulator
MSSIVDSPEHDAALRVALDAAAMGTFVWQILDDRCELDRRMLTLLDLPAGRSPALADIIRTCVHPDDQALASEVFADAVDSAGPGTLNAEIRVRHSDGSMRWLIIIGHTIFEPVPAQGAAGTSPVARAVRLTAIATDITDRKRREANHALLDDIADDCARWSSPQDIMRVVGARLGEYLRVPSVCLVDVDETRDEFRIAHMWNEDGTPSRPHLARISEFLSADLRSAARRGEIILVHDTESDPRTHASAHASITVRAFMSVPFIRDGEWRFILAVCDSRPHLWHDDEVSFFGELADRLFARLEHALAEQAVANDLRDTQCLRDLSGRLVSESDTQAFFDAIVAAAISMTGARAGCLQLLDPDANDLVLLAYDGFAPGLAAGRFGRVSAASLTSCGQALASGRRVVIDLEHQGLADAEGTLRLLIDAGVRSAQSTPLVTRAGRTVGMLSTHWAESHRQLSERELRFLDLLARQAAELIEWRRNQDALRESERRLSAELADTQLLQRLSAQLIQEQGTASLYETLVDAATAIMRSEFASMQMLHPHRGSRGELRLIASRNFDEKAKEVWASVRAGEKTTCARALETHSRVVVSDVTHCEFMAASADQKKLLDGGIRALQSTPLVSRGGKLLGIISTHWAAPHQPSERDFRLLDILARQAADLIERTQAEEALRRSETRLIEADRRKDEFLATLAHELRNPLAPLRTSLELLRLVNTPEAVEEVRVTMEEQVDLLIRLVDDLLEVSRITSGKIRLQRRPTPLASLIATAVQANRAALEAAGVALSVDMPDAPVPIDADPLRFVQIVSNVLHNAIKFTDAGGRIRIAGEVTQSRDPGARHVIVTITDSGVGISKEMLPRVFDPFTQDDETAYRSNAGLGIGLSLARRLIEMHGGSIEAHSAGAGEGSTFTLRMPLATETADQRPAPSRPIPTRINRRVLVIDDNPAAALAIERLVKALGGECRVAHDGVSGLDHIRQLRPDIVILDIGMPKVDGYETCRRIREEFGSDVVIVALTGWGQERDKQKAMRAGFDAHLIKPPDPEILEELLATGRVRERAEM